MKTLAEDVLDTINTIKDNVKRRFRDTKTYRRKIAAKKGWMKYRTSYDIGNRKKDREID